MEDLSLLAGQAAQYGFPMVISWYLLVRMEEKLENLAQSIERLRMAVKME
ncbi:YvrJ family protein [Acidaminococcus fermentans]|nr:YvrJ family protein [Acidaminococcus fermentans]MEE1598480.1 YvrJ family protein [Acidaminococcus fermentans]MEE4122742.1 YvrJ family protein [Acidaminococcus fermentans]